MKIEFKFSINFKRASEQAEEHHREGNNFATVESSDFDHPAELQIGFQRNEYWEDDKRVH